VFGDHLPEYAALILFIVGALVLAAVFLSVARGAKAGPEPYDRVAHAGYTIRRYWFYIVVVLALLALGFTLPHMPYPVVRESRAGAAAMTVQVVAQQWQWTVTPSVIPANKAIRFEVTSKDVNHDFGIFDAQMHIVGQVQAMPGFTNVLYMRFPQPGVYMVRCLELCGLFHTSMLFPNLQVVAQGP
jgi:cytochrome c oxidase subunit 2